MENNSENSNVCTPSEVCTPSKVFKGIKSNLSKNHHDHITVVGKIKKEKEKGYVKLSDDNDNAKITLCRKDNNDYQEGSKVKVIGDLTYEISNGAIYPKLNVKSVEVIEQNMEGDFIGYLLSIAKQESVNILLIYGQGAQVHRDFEIAFYQSIGYYKDKVKLEFKETKLNDDDLSKTLQQIDTSKYHLVFIIRGGGSEEDLSRVGGEKSAKVIIKKDIPLCLALGHSLDKGFSTLERVAAHVFPTHSIAGQETGGLLRLCFKEEENIDFRAQIIKEQETVKKMEADIKALKGRSNILYAIIFTLFVLLVFLTVKHHF
ncbi:MAG: hypothetical protein QXV17_14425 [Candidatus Micrarchaeaceae archaeon]